MWTFIIVLVIIIIGKFVFATSQQKAKYVQIGGIKTKYATLVDYLLNSHDRCRILQENTTFVAIGINGPACSQVYYIYPSYGNVTIRMEIKNNPLFGNMKHEWTFSENMNQEDMIRNINNDLENLFRNTSM